MTDKNTHTSKRILNLTFDSWPEAISLNLCAPLFIFITFGWLYYGVESSNIWHALLGGLAFWLLIAGWAFTLRINYNTFTVWHKKRLAWKEKQRRATENMATLTPNQIKQLQCKVT